MLVRKLQTSRFAARQTRTARQPSHERAAGQRQPQSAPSDAAADTATAPTSARATSMATA